MNQQETSTAESEKQEIRVRVAPSPTGDPHVGTGYIALFNRAFAKASGGKFLLRIEDTDRERSSPDSETAIFRSLRWLGLDWDEGPDVGGHCGPYRQSERRDLYDQHVQMLIDKGAAYRCFCTRERLDELRTQQKAAKLRLGYDGHCRSVPPGDSAERAAAGEPFVIRLRVPNQGQTSFYDQIRQDLIAFENVEIDDQVLLKSDGWPTYHLASVVDDHLMGITDVIRAEEWITSTPKHILIYEGFGWPAPRFFHLPLLRNKDKSKISKRKNPTSLDWYKEHGYLPRALVNFLALMGCSMGEDREVFSFEEMVAEFDWKRVKTSEPVFDLEKLEWLNGHYLRELGPDQLKARLLEGGYADSEEQLNAAGPMLPQIQERMKTLCDFRDIARYLFDDEMEYDAQLLIPKKKTAAEVAELLGRAERAFAQLDDWNSDGMDGVMKALGEETGWKNRDLYQPVRVAITFSKSSPPIYDSMLAIGKARSLQRLVRAKALLERT